MNILVIDDAPEITDMLSNYLSLKNHQCNISNDGKSGISLILENSYDGIILDLAMPEFSGFDVLDELQKKDKIDSNNIIILTAVPLTEKDKSLLMSYGVKEILRKPVDLKTLIGTLEKHS